MSLNYYAPRTCYEFVKGETGRDSQKTGPLSSYRECPAYVLLGQPGIGKTAAFEHEATQPNCQYVTARDFITFDIKPEWQNKTLFIDGLDEVRAGKDDVFSPFDEIRKKLEQLGRPRFRLSCREADWYGASDREELEKVSPDGEIKELYFVELTEEDLRQILIKNHHKTEAEASSFLEEARRRELIDLIKNPQILEMLVVAVGEGNEWPEGKVDVFRLACEKLLLEEWNQTHNVAHRNQTPPSEELMLASGMLCSVMLLARKQGFASLRSDADDNFPYVADMATDHREHLDLVAKTRLFTTREGHTEYSHRIFAEYLSAYYLSNKIINGKLPIGRVLALTTGNDGGVVSELRGVYAWLVTLCQKERYMLMERDPLGLVLYGDASLFSKEERLELLYKLTAQARKTADTGVRYENLRSFGAFCQIDIMQEFRVILESTDRSDGHQNLIEFVLASMTHGAALPGLSDVLVSLIYDDDLRWWSRRQSLDVLIRFNDEGVLRKILTDLDRSRISDPDDDLLGELLGSLYPDRITPSEIFDYLRPRNNSKLIGSFYHFWAFDITEKARDAQVAELLDALALRQATLNHDQDALMRREMISNVLARGVRIFGDSIEIERLYGWISLGLDEHGLMALRGQRGVEDIRKWLEQHPQVQKNLVEYHLVNNIKENRYERRAVNIDRLLFDALPPKDYGRWCLDKAVASKDESTRTAFLSESILALRRRQGSAGLSLELLEDAVENDALLKSYWDKNRVFSVPADYYRQNHEVKKLRARREQDKGAFLQCIRNNLGAIEAGTAEPWIFSKLGSAYYGYFIEAEGETPEERLNHFFQDDQKLMHSVLKGLRRFIHREDIPNATKIFQAHIENKYLVYPHPYRAGMDEAAKIGLQALLELNEDKIAKALAFYYVDGTGEETDWYKTLVKERPDLVAKLFIQFGTLELRAGKNRIIGTYRLAFDEDHGQVARHATLPLLENFRVRCTSKQLEPLYDLLIAALQHADRILLRRLVEKKLAFKGMNAAQRVSWLVAGLVLDADQFEQSLIEFVSGKEARISYLSRFLSYRDDQWSPVGKLPLRVVAALTGLLGPQYAPVGITDDDYMSGSASFDSSEVIIQLISRLARFQTDEATDAIESLLQSDRLSSWHPQLRRALHAQRSARRENALTHASLEQVLGTLNNGLPANVADLACITYERIQELAERIKYGNTNDFRQYWKKYPEKRQDEETCRDCFLSDLRPLLENIQIDVLPEGRYAAEGRADIKVSFVGSASYNLPIEIKCNDSKDLWHGIRKQLIERYTIDPGARGYGLYLVFWFGYENTPPHPESGPKPRTPAELEERLNQLLRNDEERKKISVCVVDCTADDQGQNLA